MVVRPCVVRMVRVVAPGWVGARLVVTARDLFDYRRA
jgi:hypothetical protein